MGVAQDWTGLLGPWQSPVTAEMLPERVDREAGVRPEARCLIAGNASQQTPIVAAANIPSAVVLQGISVLADDATIEMSAEKSIVNLAVSCDAGNVFNVVGATPWVLHQLMRMTAGARPPDAGIYCIAGQDLATMSVESRRRFLLKHLGSALSHSVLFPHFDLQQNVALSLLVNDFDRDQAMDVALAELHRLGIANFARLLPQHVSPGRLRLALLGKALVHRPSVMVCEWPEMHLSPGEAATAQSRLRHAARVDGVCIVMSSESEIFAALANKTLSFAG